MSAAWLWTQSLWRQHRRATLAIGLLVGIAVGSAMSAWVYSRRAGSAVDQWIESAQPANAVPEGCPPTVDPAVGAEVCFDLSMRQHLYDALAGNALIDGVKIGGILPVTLTSGDRSVATGAGSTIARAGAIDRPFVVQGRPAAEDVADEITLTPAVAELLGVGLGDLVDAEVCDWQYIDPDTPCTTVVGLRVVGLEENVDSFRPNRTPPPGRLTRTGGYGTFVPAATWAAMSDGHTAYTTTVVRMADGVSFDDVRAELGAALPGYSVRVGSAENVAAFDALRRSAGIQRATWWVVAATLALIAAVFVAQTVSRQLHREMTDRDVVRSLGAPRSIAAATGAIRNLPTAAIAAITAAIVTVTASRFGPRGVAGRLDPGRQLHWDATVLVVGIAAIVVFTLAVSALAAMVSPTKSAQRRVGILPSRLAATRPVVRAGWSLGGAGRRQFVWPAAVSLMSVMVAVSVASSLSGNLQRTKTDPAAFGAAWDYGLVSTSNGGLISEEQFDAAIGQVNDDPNVTSAAFIVRVPLVTVEGASPFSPIAFISVKGEIDPVLLEGRPPVADDEIAVGPLTLDELGLHMGDEMPSLTVAGLESGESAEATVGPFEIVGVALISDDDDDNGPGKGVILTSDALFTLDPDGGEATLVVTTDHSLPPASEADRFTQQFGPYLTVPSPQIAITNLESLATMPWVIAWFLVLLAAAALFHALVNCTSLGARQLSTLRALGFETAQVRRSVIALTLLVAVPAVALGALLGAIAGTWAWSLVVERVGLAEGGGASVPAITLAALAVVAGAVVLAIVPATVAARRDLLSGLRHD